MIAVDVWAVSWMFGLWTMLFRMAFRRVSHDELDREVSTERTIAIILVAYFSGVFFARITFAILREFGVVA